MSGGHAVVARYDLIALDALNDECVFIGESTSEIECPRSVGVADRVGRADRGARRVRQPDPDGHGAAGPGLGAAERR